jgi:methyl-accepting chemotaxis protein
MDQVTQQNAAMVEQTAAAGHTLNSGAQRLAGLVGRFRTQDAVDAAPRQRRFARG